MMIIIILILYLILSGDNNDIETLLSLEISRVPVRVLFPTVVQFGRCAEADDKTGRGVIQPFVVADPSCLGQL